MGISFVRLFLNFLLQHDDAAAGDQQDHAGREDRLVIVQHWKADDAQNGQRQIDPEKHLACQFVGFGSILGAALVKPEQAHDGMLREKSASRFRLFYLIDEKERIVKVLAIEQRQDAY